MAEIALTDCGFTFGAAEVTRLANFAETVVIEISTTAGRKVTVYVSPAGRSLRVYANGTEVHRG